MRMGYANFSSLLVHAFGKGAECNNLSEVENEELDNRVLNLSLEIVARKGCKCEEATKYWVSKERSE